MKKELKELREVLVKGQRLSKQGSYQRRAPAKPAVPHLLSARVSLHEFTQENPSDSEAWRLLSVAEECLLNYRGALQCLEKAMSISPTREKRDLKRLAMLREASSQWENLPLTPTELEALGEFLASALAVESCDHTLSITKAWLQAVGQQKSSKVLHALRNLGGYCDCEVLSNVVSS